MQLTIENFHVPARDPRGNVIRDENGKVVPMTREQLNLRDAGVLIGYLLLKCKKVSLFNHWEDPAMDMLMYNLPIALKATFPDDPEMWEGWHPMNKPPAPVKDGDGNDNPEDDDEEDDL